jgi:hypothetical protein
VIANLHYVTIDDGLTSDPLTEVLDSIGASQIDDVVLTIFELDHGVLSRDVGILDGQITGLLATPNDELVFGDSERLPLVADDELSRRLGS